MYVLKDMFVKQMEFFIYLFIYFLIWFIYFLLYNLKLLLLYNQKIEVKIFTDNLASCFLQWDMFRFLINYRTDLVKCSLNVTKYYSQTYNKRHVIKIYSFNPWNSSHIFQALQLYINIKRILRCMWLYLMIDNLIQINQYN
jgi:hypothetical protein